MKTKEELKQAIAAVNCDIALNSIEGDSYLVECLQHQLNKLENELYMLENGIGA